MFDLVGKERAVYRRRIAERIKERWAKFDEAIEPQDLIRERFGEQKDEKRPFDYVIFIDIEGDLDWLTGGGDESDLKKSQRIISEIMAANHYPCSGVRVKFQLAYKRLLGEALACAFENNEPKAIELLIQAKGFLVDRTNESSRAKILLLALLLAGTCVLGYYSCRNMIPDVDLIPFLFGAAGAFASIVGRIGRRVADANAGWWLHVLEVVSRFALGMVMGKMATVLVDSGVALSFCKEWMQTGGGEKVIAFGAGLFDMFVPAWISRYLLDNVNRETTEERQ